MYKRQDFDAEQEEISETLVEALAKKNQSQHKASLSLVQMHKKINDTTVAVYTAVADNQRSIASSKEVWGRALRQQTVASALAFNLLRKFLQDV